MRGYKLDWLHCFCYFFLFSCSRDEEMVIIDQSLNIQIENKKFQLVNDNFLAEETCNDLLIKVSYENYGNNFNPTCRFC